MNASTHPLYGREPLIKSKPRLLPVKVPWAVAADTPYLRLFASEGDEPTHVRFVAFFELERAALPEPHAHPNPPEKARIVYPPYNSNIQLGPKAGVDQIVKVTFTGAIKARMESAFSDASAIDYAAFDGSAMSFDPNERVLDIDEWIKNFREEWHKTVICPNPRMYKVEHSSWVDKQAAEQGFKHYIVVGHDAYVEVMATDWKWESEGAVRT